MCGRFNLRLTTAQLQEFFDLFRVPELSMQYNIAPTDPAVAIRLDPQQKSIGDFLEWGLPKLAGKPYTIARSESVGTTPRFRDAFRQRRCIVPASGYYEWPETSGRYKDGWHFFPASGEPMAFAGLWESSPSAGGMTRETFCILTREAQEELRVVHHRMPLILPRELVNDWLNPQASPERLQELIRSVPVLEMDRRPTHPYVNSSKNKGPQCLDPPEVVQRTLFEDML